MPIKCSKCGFIRYRPEGSACPQCSGEMKTGSTVSPRTVSPRTTRAIVPAIGGQIKFFGLEQWWRSLTQYEQSCLLDADDKMKIGSMISAGSFIALASGPVGRMAKNEIDLLTKYAMILKNKKTKEVAKKIIDYAENYANSVKVDDLTLHFMYSAIVEIYYMNRDTSSTSLEEAISACEKHIAFSNHGIQAWKDFYGKLDEMKAKIGDNSPKTTVLYPRHIGYEQLAIIYEKQHKYQEAIDLCQKAMTDGWAGDWDKRIARCLVKLAKQK